MNKARLINQICLLSFMMLSLSASSKLVMLNDEQGLSNNLVTAISKDKTGNLWVGTKKGLNQYDGYSFVSIAQFNKSVINCLQYDNFRNLLWVGTDNGLFYMDCETKSVFNCTPINKKYEVSNLLMSGKDIYVGFRLKWRFQ